MKLINTHWYRLPDKFLKFRIPFGSVKTGFGTIFEYNSWREYKVVPFLTELCLQIIKTLCAKNSLIPFSATIYVKP